MKIVNRVPQGTHTVGGVRLAVTKLVWTDGGRSYEVHDMDGDDLTVDGCFDNYPDEGQLQALLDARARR